MSTTDPASQAAPAWLPDRTELGRQIAVFPWADTPLGPLETWSLSLRNAVSTCVSSNFPLLLVWGPELINIYNDGFAEMIGPTKHPRALGASARNIWPEVWDTVGPMFEHVMSTGEATWSENELLKISRHGFAEECYFHFSYSPLFDDDGRINGVLDISIETTQAVVAQRRLRAIADLNARLASTDAPTDACVAAIGALSAARPDVRAADVFLRVGDDLFPVASNRGLALSIVPGTALHDVVRTGRRLVLGAGDDGRAQHVVVPLTASGDQVNGALAVTLSDESRFDESYASFVDVLGQTIGVAVERAQRRSEALGQLQYVNETLQQAMLPSVNSTEAFVARYLPAANHLSVGGDWYDVVDLDTDRRALVVGDCVGHDLDAATAMAQLRSASRALLLEDHGPASMVATLDQFARSIDGGACASVVCLVIDHASDTLTYCRAGHPPPLLATSDGVTVLDGAGGPVLGLAVDVDRSDVTLSFTPGDVLVLYTDGLVERRHHRFADRFARLVRLVGETDRRDLGAVAEQLLTGMLDDDDNDDDVVVLVKGLGAGQPPSGRG